MLYLTFLFLFFANLFQTKLFCHLSLMSFPLLIKEKGIQHLINTGLLFLKKKRNKRKRKRKEKKFIFSMAQRYTVVMKVFLSGTRMEIKATTKHTSMIMVGSYSNIQVALGSVAFKILQTFLWSSFLAFSATSPVPKYQNSIHISLYLEPMLSGSLLLAYITSSPAPLSLSSSNIQSLL